MKSIIRFDYLAALIVALFFIVPNAYSASDSKDSKTVQAQPPAPVKKSVRAKTGKSVHTLRQPAAKAETKPSNPNTTSLKSPQKSRTKSNFKAPGLAPIKTFKPHKTQVGIPQIKIKPGGLGDIPVPNDMAVGITIPGSESSSLTIGSPGDSHEQEADSVADRVMSPKSNPALLPGNASDRKPDADPAGPVSGQSTPGSVVGLDPRDNPGDPVSGLGSPGGAVSLDPRDDPSGPISGGQ